MGRLSAAGVLAAMNAASAVVVPSRTTEGFSLVALEAAHAARPVIATGVGGLAETVQDGVTGLIVPPDDPAALAAAINRLLDDPGLASMMGLAAQDRALAHFGVEPCLSGYRGLYHDLATVGIPERMLEAERRGA